MYTFIIYQSFSYSLQFCLVLLIYHINPFSIIIAFYSAEFFSRFRHMSLYFMLISSILLINHVYFPKIVCFKFFHVLHNICFVLLYSNAPTHISFIFFPLFIVIFRRFFLLTFFIFYHSLC